MLVVDQGLEGYDGVEGMGRGMLLAMKTKRKEILISLCSRLLFCASELMNRQEGKVYLYSAVDITYDDVRTQQPGPRNLIFPYPCTRLDKGGTASGK